MVIKEEERVEGVGEEETKPGEGMILRLREERNGSRLKVEGEDVVLEEEERRVEVEE